jgi:hypothetical protein
MIILAIDPGKRSPGEAWTETGQPIYVTSCPFAPDLVLLEEPYPNPDSSRQSLITLGLHAGLHAGRRAEFGADILVAKPQEWRAVFGRGYRNKPKDQLHNCLWRDYADRLPVTSSPDERDAAALLLAYLINPFIFRDPYAIKSKTKPTAPRKTRAIQRKR